MAEKINVLLSTYNGKCYLPKQLDSILRQTYRDIVVTVRDDGSRDNTLELLRSYAERQSQIVESESIENRPLLIHFGSNVGASGSFFELLRLADSDCKYFAFCDQDDVWPETKLENAVSLLAGHDSTKPLLYCSKVEFVDANLGHLGYSSEARRIGFGNALVENIAIGCTVVINRATREKLLEHPPQQVIMHDWWTLLVAMAFGEVVYDPRPNIKYRQHGANVLGGTANALEHFKRRTLRFLKSTGNTFRPRDQAAEFYSSFSAELKQADKALIEGFLASKSNLWTRCKYALSMPVWRQSTLDTLILRLLIMLGRY